MNLEKYLDDRHTKATANRYLRDINIYCKEVSGHQSAVYSEIMDYIGSLRKRYKNPETIKCTLQGIKKYYGWLVATGQRKDHPCKFLYLKDKRSKDIQLQDLFSTEELEILLDRQERFAKLKLRNQIILGLLIYQGITTGEITRIELKDVNMETGELYIKASSKQNSRTLKLKPKQILPLDRYMTEIRPELVKRSTDRLIINQRGNPETGTQISYLVSTFKHYFAERNLNPKTIRQSVISNLLKAGNDLRVVQVYAGHKYPSSTEQYKQANVEQLKKQVEKYHPLK